MRGRHLAGVWRRRALAVRGHRLRASNSRSLGSLVWRSRVAYRWDPQRLPARGHARVRWYSTKAEDAVTASTASASSATAATTPSSSSSSSSSSPPPLSRDDDVNSNSDNHTRTHTPAADRAAATGSSDSQKRDEDANAMPSPAMLARIGRMLRPEAKLLSGAFASLLVSAGATLVFPRAIGGIMDAAASASDVVTGTTQLQSSVMMLGGVFVVGGIASFTRILCLELASANVVVRLRKQLFSSVVRQEVGFFDTAKTGELINRFSTDTTVMSNAMTSNISMGLRRVLEGCGGVAILLWLSPSLTAVMLGVVPPVALGGVYFGRFIRRKTEEVMTSIGKTTDIAEERFNGIRTVRSFGQEQRELGHYARQVDDVFQLSKRIAFGRSAFFGGLYVAINTALVAVLWKGSLLVLTQEMSVGDLTSFLFYSMYVGFAFSGVSGFFGDIMKGIGASTRVFELIERKPAIALDEGGTVEPLVGRVTFERVGFTYPTRLDAPVLQGVSFDVRPGEAVAVVGASGSGKSTIAHLITRFYDPDCGRVLLDGIPLTELSPSWLSENVGIVSQDVFLFSGTVYDNIAYAKPDATRDEVVSAAKRAYAHHFIEKFPDAYDTQVGSRGNALSGGQRQRIAIARAILKDPKILILDEATSSLDMDSEAKVQKALAELMRDRTTIMIAHRLSSLKDATKIIVLDGGVVAEEGTHEQLLAANGLYSQLQALQYIT